MHRSLLLFGTFLLGGSAIAAPSDIHGELSDAGQVIVAAANKMLEDLPRQNIPIIGAKCLRRQLNDMSTGDAGDVLRAAASEDAADLAAVKELVAKATQQEQAGRVSERDRPLLRNMGLFVIDGGYNNQVFDDTICKSLISASAPLIDGDHALLVVRYTTEEISGGFSIPMLLKRGRSTWYVSVQGEGVFLHVNQRPDQE
mgnify:FL=1